jgi:glycosyltransferase involved in cell wall biosynthesis
MRPERVTADLGTSQKPAGGAATTDRPRRVLRVVTRLVVSGPSTHVVLADRGLRERGWETLLVHGTVEPDEREIDIAAAGIPTQRVPALARPVSPGRDLRAFRDLVRIIRRYRPDVIHTHQSKAGLLARAAAHAGSSAIRVHTFHGTVFEGYFGSRTSRAIIVAEQLLAARTHRLVALSETLRAELVDRGVAPADRITVIPLGVDLEAFADPDRDAARRERAIPDGEFAIVSLARFAPIKRFDRAIRVLAEVRTTHPTAVLHLVGDGSIRAELEQLADSLGVADAVRFEGWTADPAGWLAAADVVLLTSDNEGTPLALVEASAAGRPVVATDVGGVAAVVRHGETGLLAAPADEQGLAAALGRLAAEPETRHRMGEAGRLAARRFGADRLADDLDALYRELLDRRKPAVSASAVNS